MGKTYLYGRGDKSIIVEPHAKLTVTCGSGLTVCVSAVQSSLTFKTISDDTGKAVFDRLVEGAWDVTVIGVDNPPTERIIIDRLDCNVSFPYATLHVTYPRGSTCTCVKGDIVLTASDNSGSCCFDIYELGDWSVSSTNGVESDAEIVSITSFADVKNVKLLHDIWIIDNSGSRQVFDPVDFWGNDDTNVEMAIVDDGSVSFKFSTSQTDSAISNTELDLTDYAYIYITSTLDRDGTMQMSVLHPASLSAMSGMWTFGKHTTTNTVKCNITSQTDNRLLRIWSNDVDGMTLTIHALSLRLE